MLITGFEGPITIASAPASASSTSGVGSAASIPSSSTPSTVGRSNVPEAAREVLTVSPTRLAATRSTERSGDLRCDQDGGPSLEERAGRGRSRRSRSGRPTRAPAFSRRGRAVVLIPAALGVDSPESS